MKLTGTNKPITYTTHPAGEDDFKRLHIRGGEMIKLLASTMWFPDNNPRCCQEQKPQLNMCPFITTRFSSDFPTTAPRAAGAGERVTAVIAEGKRPVPFRTRKLSPPAPMVLHSTGCGRVGHRRTYFARGPPYPGGPLGVFRTSAHGHQLNRRPAAQT